MSLRAPFPWFGGKSKVAPLVWDRFGGVPNYVEPFAGSLAVLLGRPLPGKVETVNDKDCFIANFWRAVHQAPEEVAHWARQPVNEADLHARHLWLINREEFRERMKTDPHHYDAKIAGWWVWGVCLWIGGGWCEPRTGRTIRSMPGISGPTDQKWTGDWAGPLTDRLRNVRVCCGDWKRVLGPAQTTGMGLTAVFLDPPYSSEANRDGKLYAEEDLDVAHDVRRWAIEHGDDPQFRIALCGYEGEHAMPASWECVPWKANGGYANQGQGRGRENAGRERVWFSPHCLTVGLFGRDDLAYCR